VSSSSEHHIPVLERAGNDPDGAARADAASPLIRADAVSRVYGEKHALVDVTLHVARGEICGLIGPNGAGKTTLLRLLTGLLDPSSGTVRILGEKPAEATRRLRQRVGLVPSGDRTFYLRISGLENLAFFARMHGLGRRAAVAEARRALAEVDLVEAQHRAVGEYSHGMQKRLSVARALITRPEILLVDEATHDLDPEGGRVVRNLVADIAARGAAVVWATQKLDELRGFADRVMLLSGGRTMFSGTLPDLIALSSPRRYVLRVRNGGLSGESLAAVADRLLGDLGTLRTLGEGESSNYVLALERDAILGDALAALARGRMDILTCHEERSELEEAFLSFTRSDSVDPQA
jgi:ABC-2 type transport system ATP-binding protein